MMRAANRHVAARLGWAALWIFPLCAGAAPTDISLAAPTPAASAQAMPAPSSETMPPETPGDLSHLEYTATSNLTAVLIAPAPGSSSDREATAFEVSTVAGAGIELAVDGAVVEANHIGKRRLNKRTGETQYFFYGVRLRPGPNEIVVTALGAGSVRGTPVRATVFGPGQPVRIEAKLIGALKADGRTPAVFQILGFDRWNHPALPGSTVHVAIVKGDAHFEAVRSAHEAELPAPSAGAASLPVSDLVASAIAPEPAVVPTPAAGRAANGDLYGEPATPAQPGQDDNHRAIADRGAQFQSLDVLLLSHGVATLALVPGLVPGDLVIRTTFASTHDELRAFVAPALRKPMLIGLATAGVGSVPGVPGESADAPSGANARKGRIALYGVGQIGRNAQVTVAYDTAKTLATSDRYGSFADNPDDRPYQTYGDASVRRDDALSRDHLYLRIDDKRSSAMWGEFQASTGGTSGIGGYNELVDGAKVELAGNNAKLDVFAARNDIAYARQIFSPTGLSNLGGLLHSDIVVGSDTITVVALDRRTGAILSQTILTRNVDYTLDYASGFLRFLNPPLPFDTSFDPQQVLVTYEYGGPGANAETTGGRFEAGLGSSQAVRLGIGYVNDATGGGNLALANEDLTGTLAGGGWSLGHIASRGALPGTGGLAGLGSAVGTSGDAYQFTLATALGVNKIDLGFETTSPGYNNPFGGLSTPGLLDYHAAFTRPLGREGSITAGFDHEQNNLAAAVNAQSNASVHVRLPLGKRLTATAGVDVRSTSAFSASAATTAAATGAVGNQQLGTVATPAPVNAGTLPAYTSNGAGSAQVQTGLSYQLNKVFTLAANRVSNLGKSQNASQPAQTTVELDADIAKRGRVFIRQLWADAPTTSFAAATATLTGIDGARSSTAIGIERAIGPTTDVDTEYVIDHTANGSDAYAELGVREKLIIAKNLRGEASFQRASAFGGFGAAVDGSGSTGVTPAASGFNVYGLSLAYSIARFHASGQYQLRTGDNRGYTLDLGAAGALSPDFTAFVSSNASSTGTGFNNVDAKATVAYRPSVHDRSVTLFSYERQDGNVSNLGTHAEILSLEELVRPTRLTEIAARYAYKLDGDAYYPARSSLFGVRVDERIATRFDIAAETRFLSTHGIPNANTTAFALEAGYRIGDDLRVAGGYNFSGSPDPSLVSAPTRRGLYGTVTSVFDSIFGWGKDDH